ncbi:MAG: nitroreductase family deazaflavin-dependent oxidoreductase [Chloroflexota bacterium]
MMSEKSLVAKPPSGWLRLMLRLPILLYRLKLGWLLGERFVLLNHLGRKTGQVHQTVVEIIGHNAAQDTYYIVSGWGYKANWYQNLLARPNITVQIGRHQRAIRAETLTPSAGVQVLLDYRKHHPLASRELSRLMGIDLSAASSEALQKIVQESLPIVVLRPLQA